MNHRSPEEAISTYMHAIDMGTGPAVLLIHGFLGSHFSWRHQVKPLVSAGFRAVAVDLPGFGDSFQPWEADHSHTAFADACARLLRERGLASVHVAGHSMGGRVALWLAIRYPQLVRSMTLVSPSVFSAPMKAVTKIPGALILARWLLRRRWSSPTRFRNDLARFYGKPQPDEVVADYWRRYQRPENQLGALAHFRDAAGPSVVPRLADVQVPVQLVWGEADGVFPVEQAHRLAALIPGARLAILPGADHFVPESAPDAFNKLFLAFLNALPHEDSPHALG